MDFRKLLSAKAPTIADLERSVAALDGEANDAARDLMVLQDGRRAVLLSGSDDDLRRHDDAMGAASRRRERALAALEEVAGRLTAAQTAKAAGERRAAYDAASLQVDAARDLLRREYPGVVDKVRTIVRALAEADLARMAANADLPDGAPPLPSPEDIRGPMFEPATETGRRTVKRWVDTRNEKPLPTSMQELLNANGGQAVLLPQPFNSALVAQRTFDEVTTLPQRLVPPLPALAGTIRLPGLDHAAFGFEHDDTALTPDQIARAVLATLARLQAADGRGLPPRTPEIEMVAIAKEIAA